METKPEPKKGIVEALRKDKKGILIKDDTWHFVEGKALDYVKDELKGAEIEYALNEKHQIIFLRVLNSTTPPKIGLKEDTPVQKKDRAILLQVCIKAAAALPFIKSVDEVIEATNKFLSNAEEKLKEKT